MTYLQLIVHTVGLIGKQNILKDGHDLAQRGEAAALATELLGYLKMALLELAGRTNLCVYLLEQTADGKGKIVLDANGRHITAVKSVRNDQGDKLPFACWGNVVKTRPFTPCLVEVYALPLLPQGIDEQTLQTRPDIPARFETAALCYHAASLYFAVQNQLGLAAYWQQRFDDCIKRTYSRHQGGNLAERTFL